MLYLKNELVDKRDLLRRLDFVLALYGRGGGLACDSSGVRLWVITDWFLWAFGILNLEQRWILCALNIYSLSNEMEKYSALLYNSSLSTLFHLHHQIWVVLAPPLSSPSIADGEHGEGPILYSYS
jgi:hypothetical protein